MLKSLVVREMQITSAMRYQFIPVKMTAIKKQITKCWSEMWGEIGTLLPG